MNTETSIKTPHPGVRAAESFLNDIRKKTMVVEVRPVQSSFFRADPEIEKKLSASGNYMVRFNTIQGGKLGTADLHDEKFVAEAENNLGEKQRYHSLARLLSKEIGLDGDKSLERNFLTSTAGGYSVVDPERDPYLASYSFTLKGGGRMTELNGSNPEDVLKMMAVKADLRSYYIDEAPRKHDKTIIVYWWKGEENEAKKKKTNTKAKMLAEVYNLSSSDTDEYLYALSSFHGLNKWDVSSMSAKDKKDELTMYVDENPERFEQVRNNANRSLYYVVGAGMALGVFTFNSGKFVYDNEVLGTSSYEIVNTLLLEEKSVVRNQIVRAIRDKSK